MGEDVASVSVSHRDLDLTACSQDYQGLIPAGSSMMVSQHGEMIEFNEARDAKTSQRTKSRRLGGLLAGAVGLLGALLIALGTLNLGWPTNSSPESAEIIETNDAAAAAGLSATATTVVQSVADDPGAVALTDVSGLANDLLDSVVTVESMASFRGRQVVVGSGSGVVVSDDGTIVTNAHVVEEAESIVVVLADGSEYVGTILEVDVEGDLAAVHIEASGLSPVALGSSDDLAVGQGVIAVGYPLGLEGSPSISTGIVSALDRTLEEGGISLTNVIQTDAAITEGSSGGALFDSSGRLIGLTTAVGVSSVGIEGIGFAIPVESILDTLSTLDGI